MQIDVIATAQQVKEEQVKGKTVVVIDVLRATSVMVTALQNGAKAIVPVLAPEEAFDLKAKLETNIILGGERHAEPIPGFDYGNSPLSYTPQVIKDKILVMTTTNGTLAINNSLSANELLVASFLNSHALCEYLANKSELVLVCSGNNGLYTLEDALCAGHIIYLLEQAGIGLRCSDFALSVKALYELNKDNLEQFAAKGYHYGVLQQKGYEEDLHYCFTEKVCDVIPYWNGQAIVSK